MPSELAIVSRRWKTPAPASLHGEWKQLYLDTVDALLDRYASRGPQYEMLCDLAAGLYVQVRRMEATGAIRGLESLDVLIARQLRISDDAEVTDELVAEAQHQLAEGAAAVRTYLQAVEALRKLIEQSQRYTEARRQEIVVTEVNSAVVEVLRIVETHVDPQTFSKIIVAVRAALDGKAA
jgi:hypothetical protein